MRNHSVMILAALVALAAAPEMRAQTPRTAEARIEATADSMNRIAREELNRGNYVRAASVYRTLQQMYPTTSAAHTALYWQAFAHYRIGSPADLREARQVLESHRATYPDAWNSDAQTLALRISASLAQFGDAMAAEAVTAAAIAPAPPAPVAPGRAAVAAPPAAPAAPAPPAGRGHRTALPAHCPDDEHEIRVAALQALMQVDSDQAMPILHQVLERRDECSVELRRRAVFLVQQKRTPETDRILLDVARNDPDPDVRGQAVHWLGSVRSERAVQALEEILRTSDDRQLRERALFALSRHPSPRGSEILRRMVEDDTATTEMRRLAIFWLAERTTAEPGYLRSLYGRIQDPGLKEHILFSLSRSRDREDSQFLLNVAMRADEPIELRKRALFWAAQRQAVLPQGELIAMYDRVTDREMKEQLVYLYSQRRTEETTTKLIDIVRNERDQELRKRAIFWLSQSRDPRAAEVLREVIAP